MARTGIVYDSAENDPSPTGINGGTPIASVAERRFPHFQSSLDGANWYCLRFSGKCPIVCWHHEQTHTYTNAQTGLGGPLWSAFRAEGRCQSPRPLRGQIQEEAARRRPVPCQNLPPGRSASTVSTFLLFLRIARDIRKNSEHFSEHQESTSVLTEGLPQCPHTGTAQHPQ